MPKKTETDDPGWAARVVDLRRRMHLSQEELAEKVHTCQTTVSRWETGRTTPTVQKRKLLEELAQRATDKDASELEMINVVARAIVENLTAPALLFMRNGMVIATTPGTEYRTGLTVREQIAPEELHIQDAFEAHLEKIKFWSSPASSIDYYFVSRGENRCNSATPLRIGSYQFCLMQRKAVTGPG